MWELVVMSLRAFVTIVGMLAIVAPGVIPVLIATEKGNSDWWFALSILFMLFYMSVSTAVLMRFGGTMFGGA